jgi:hypothetical protein
MQNIEGGGLPAMSGDRDETHRAVVAELASVIEHIRKSRQLIDSAIAGEAAAEEATADNVIVLDDVTPGYERVDAALRQCEAGLNVSLRLLQGPARSGEAARESA